MVVGISGGVDSALVAGLCSRTGLQTVGVLMPCHSPSESIKRAEEVVRTFGLREIYIKLDEMENFTLDALTNYGIEPVEADTNWAHGGLRSSLRTPVIDYVAKCVHGIIVGTGNRDEDELVRYYNKRGDACVDINPIAWIHKSEVYQLAREIGVPESVLKAAPSADLWDPETQTDEGELGMTYDEIEWGSRFAQEYSGFPRHFNDGWVTLAHLYAAKGNAGAMGVSLTKRQGDVLVMLAEMEQRTRHKTCIPKFKFENYERSEIRVGREEERSPS